MSGLDARLRVFTKHVAIAKTLAATLAPFNLRTWVRKLIAWVEVWRLDRAAGKLSGAIETRISSVFAVSLSLPLSCHGGRGGRRTGTRERRGWWRLLRWVGVGEWRVV